MEPSVSDQESFIARRKLFKNIWDQSTVNFDISTAKSKVIKTLRLSDEDTANILKRKQEIKKLKSVCNKLLKLHDKQNAGVTNEEQAGPSNVQNIPEIHVKRKKKIRIVRIKRKIKKKTSMCCQRKGWSMSQASPYKRRKSPACIFPLKTVIQPQYKIKHTKTKKRKKRTKITTTI